MDSAKLSEVVAYLVDSIVSLENLREKRADSFKALTIREKLILTLVAEGGHNAAIADQLSISRATVQNHRASIRQKLNIKSDADYVKLALAYNLIGF